MKTMLVAAVCAFLFLAGRDGSAQQVDLALSLGTLSSSASTATSTSYGQSLRGGTYFGFNGDALIKRHLGIGAEVLWRTSQGKYAGQLPYRPLFFDVDALYFRRFSKYVAGEALAGIGAEDIRFYGSQFTQCDYYGYCTNYVSSHHFMGDVGAGLRFYVHHSFFVRPEVRLYLIHNNVEFSSGYAARYGASIGYTFGGS